MTVVRQLSDVLQYIRGVTFDPDELIAADEQGAIACMRTKNVQQVLDESDLIYVPKSVVKRDEQYLRTGDLLISSANSWELVGKTVRVGELAYPATAGGFISILRPNAGIVDPDYLYRFISWHNTQHAIRHLGRQTTNISNLDRERFLDLSIPLPPLAAQKHIASVLEQADQLRKQAQQMESELNQLAQSLFLEMFGDPISNPKGWEIAPLEKLIASGDKINYGVVQPGDDVEEGVPLVRVADLSENMDSLHDLKKIQPEIEAQYGRSRLVGDEILIGCVGSIGRVGLASSVLKGANIARAVARVRPSNDVSRLFLYFYLQTSFVQGYFRSETRTVSQPTLNISLIEKTPIIVPPLEKQREFDFAMRTIQVEMKNLRAKIASLDSLFNSLMQRAFNGELTAPERKAA